MPITPILWKDYYAGKNGRKMLTRIHPNMLIACYLQARNDCSIVSYDREYAIEKLAYELFLLRFEDDRDILALVHEALAKARGNDPNFEKTLEEIKKTHELENE